MKPIILSRFVHFPIDEATRKADEDRAARNRLILEAAVRPSSPSAVRIGDRVMPAEEQWQRGPGVVDEIDALGRVWAVFGQRENPHPTDHKTVRCVMPWREVWIVERAK